MHFGASVPIIMGIGVSGDKMKTGVNLQKKIIP